MTKWTFYTTTLLFLTFLIFGSCEKETFTTSPEDKLIFSIDTLTFDTVFTQLGSVTKSFKAYNPHDKSIKISDIRLAHSNSKFRLNIDGAPVNNATDIIILPNDSLYIFVEVTVNPDEPLSSSPFIIEEQILFTTNDNQQSVHLDAWGQNANYIPSFKSGGSDNLLSCNLQTITWDDPKPYVIYGRLFIDSCELVIPAGAKIYVHGGIARREIIEGKPLARYNDGSIIFINKGRVTINGTAEDPVIFQGDRLDSSYQEKYGQWVGLHFWNTTNNKINHAVIKNAIRGCYADSASELSIKGTKIYNTLGTGLEARHATIKMSNSLIYNNLGSAVQMIYGGKYDFDYCTFASYGNSNVALAGLNYICRDFSKCEFLKTHPLRLQINNSIIVGDQEDELYINDWYKGEVLNVMKYGSNNSIITAKTVLDKPTFTEWNKDFILTQTDDILFINQQEGDYHLDTFSIAEQMAKPLSIKRDLDEKIRDNTHPDIGCYEF